MPVKTIRSDTPPRGAVRGPLENIWRGLGVKIAAERRLIARCRADPALCPSDAALLFIAIVDEGKRQKGLARIGHINRAVNFAIRADESAAPNTWAAPLEAIAAGAGDCRQYAVIKYAALRAAGIAAANVRLIILASKSSVEGHAVVAVRRKGPRHPPL